MATNGICEEKYSQQIFSCSSPFSIWYQRLSHMSLVSDPCLCPFKKKVLLNIRSTFISWQLEILILPNTHEPDSPLTLVTIHNSIKLTSTNYLSWKTQIESILIGYDLHKFIDGSHPSPLTTIIVNNAVSPNRTYQTWLRQDRLLFGALVGTISPNLVPLINQSKTSHDAWQAFPTLMLVLHMDISNKSKTT